ncbi:MAG: hypothetical protein ACRCW9_09650 [Cetobacterium sp.]
MKKDIVRSKTTQTPFTTVGFGTETTYEGRLIQSKFLKIRSGGFGKNKDSVVVFPLVF